MTTLSNPVIVSFPDSASVFIGLPPVCLCAFTKTPARPVTVLTERNLRLRATGGACDAILSRFHPFDVDFKDLLTRSCLCCRWLSSGLLANAALKLVLCPDGYLNRSSGKTKLDTDVVDHAPWVRARSKNWNGALRRNEIVGEPAYLSLQLINVI
jgi:hypothetical protein